MKSSLPAPTLAEQGRFDAFRRIGCVACRQRGVFHRADVHHLLRGGKRRGHRYTIPLCPWHHRGILPGGARERFALLDFEMVYGSSLAHDAPAFHHWFGSDEKLLAITDKLLAERGEGAGHPAPARR
jgi:hypothetical protein